MSPNPIRCLLSLKVALCHEGNFIGNSEDIDNKDEVEKYTIKQIQLHFQIPNVLRWLNSSENQVITKTPTSCHVIIR